MATPNPVSGGQHPQSVFGSSAWQSNGVAANSRAAFPSRRLFDGVTAGWDQLESGSKRAWQNFNDGISYLSDAGSRGLSRGVDYLNNLSARAMEGIFSLNDEYKATRKQAGEYLSSALDSLDITASAVRELGKGNLGLQDLKENQLQQWAKNDDNFGLTAETMRREYQLFSKYRAPSELLSRLGKAVNVFDAAEAVSDVVDTMQQEYQAGDTRFDRTMRKIGTMAFTGAISSAAGATAAIGTAAVVGTGALAFAPLLAGAAVGIGVAKYVSDRLS